MNETLKSIENKLSESTALFKKRKMLSYATEGEYLEDPVENARQDELYNELYESKDNPGLVKLDKKRSNWHNSKQFKDDPSDEPAEKIEKHFDDISESELNNAKALSDFYRKSYEDMHQHAGDWIKANDDIQKKYAKKFKPVITKGF